MYGKLEINGVSILKLEGDMYKVRISIGDNMYFDSPTTYAKNAEDISLNIMKRLEK